MKGQFIVTKVNHYEMQDNRGLSVRVVGEVQRTNNSFGLDISEAIIPDFNELQYLQRFANQLPARFDCDFNLTTIKQTNGKERTGVSLKNLQFVNTVEFTDVKVAVSK